MGCACSLIGRDDVDDGDTGQPEWQNEVCPKCGTAFETSDRVVVDENNVAYHYDCFDGPPPS